MRAADDTFYANHPEMVRGGRRVPLDPCNTTHERMRAEWLDAYEAAGGVVASGRYSAPCDEPEQPCQQCYARLAVLVVDVNGTVVPGAMVLLQPGGFELSSDERGIANFGEVAAPEEYTVTVTPSAYSLEVEESDPDANLTASPVSTLLTVQQTQVLLCDQSVTLVVTVGREEQYDGPRCPNGCGIDSQSCADAQSADPVLADTVARARTLISWGSGMGYTNAVAALQHYFGGTGEFVEIPASKVAEVIASSSTGHAERLRRAVMSEDPLRGMGVRGRLARQLVEMGVSPGGDLVPPMNVLPLSSWPQQVTVRLDFSSGTERGGIDDDNLTYYGSTIRSMIEFQCVQVAGTRSYHCSVTTWEQYVFDNYDWEGDKAFGGDLARWIGVPTQSEMNLLQRQCCARSYARSSARWMPAHPFDPVEGIPDWDIAFDDDDAVLRAARSRVVADRTRVDLERIERRDGALPIPPPAR